MIRNVSRTMAVTAAIMLAAALGACSDKTEKKEAAAEDASQTSAGDGCDAGKCPDAMEPTYGKLGLAEHCSFGPQDDATGCFVCTPRDLPRKLCIDIDPGFDPAKNCEHDQDLMTCNVKADGEAFEFDFSEQSQIEKIYNKIPLFLLGAKVLVGGKMKDNPAAKDLLFGCFDSVLAHKKAIFTKGDLTGLLDEVGVHVKKAKPDLKDADIATVKKAMQGAADKLQESYADGKMEDEDFLQFAHGVLTALPKELIGNTLQELNIEEIMASLQASGNQDVIEDLITNAGSTEEAVNGAANAGGG